jgi:hypothetical protein
MDKAQEKNAITNQYRDWLIPVTLFTGIAASIFLYIITISPLTTILIVSAGLSILSIVLFILCLLYAVTRLEAIEYIEKGVKPDGGLLYMLGLLGIITFAASLAVLSFWKSIILGGVVTGILVIAIIVLIFIIRFESKIE